MNTQAAELTVESAASTTDSHTHDCCRRLGTLLDVADALGRTVNIDDLIHRVVECMTRAMDCERSSFFVVDWSVHELWSLKAEGALARPIRMAFGDGLASHAALDASVINVDHAYRDDRFNPKIDRETGFRTTSVLCAPVLDREGIVVGVCECINRRDGPFDDDDVQLLQAIAAQVAVAMDNSALHQREVALRSYLQKVHDSMATAVVSLDAEHRVVTCNPSARALLPGIEVGRSILEHLAPGTPLLELVHRARAACAAIGRDDLPLIVPGRPRATVNVRIMPLESVDDDAHGLVMVLQDVTREQRIRHAFKHYLAPAVVEQIVAEPARLALGGEKREVSALFTDVEGFAAVAERMEPERLVDLLNVYFNAMCNVVFRHGGTIDKIVGDSLHVLFNAPLDQRDHACRAVHCAVEMDACARGLTGGVEARGLLGRTRIGVSSGTAVVGNFGGSARFDYTAHGDAVNVASRLEGANKYLGTRILVSAQTRDACSDIAFRPVGRISLDGHRAPVSVYEPLAAQHFADDCVSRYQRAYSLLAAGDCEAGSALRALLERCPHDELTRMHLTRFDAGSRSDYIALPGK